ncbi:hypothetical protein QJS10_CPB21g00423 [Acorus calamus]|uniref:DUF7733 domain-containing protein n=1 Tax=Acorus calamus TaxID=4465 RepID=A0AAV9C6H0_ACOCL|nr:hypothetical protein QJS10_CPB21g00423 [Acorus calamus]
MSGGVGPTSADIRLPKDDDDHHPPPPSAAPRRRILTFRQLNMLAIITVLSASGMVSPEDLAFSLFSLFYTLLLSRIAFPTTSLSPPPPVFGEKNLLLNAYILIAAVVGLLLPIAYIFEGVREGDKEGIKAAAPHVFLLACQVFMEGLTFSQGLSLPVRVFVPVFYNTKRIFTIVDWLRSEVAKVDEEFGSLRRLHVGRGLAVANLGFWAFNLFGFLLPVYFPRAFRLYYVGGSGKGKKV